MTQIKKSPSVLFSLCFLSITNIFSSAQSQTLAGNPGVIWSDSPAGNYDQADLWAFPVWGGSVGIPNSSSNAFIFNGDLSVTNGGNFNPNQLVLGWEPTHTGKFTQTGGTVRTESWTRVGWSRPPHSGPGLCANGTTGLGKFTRMSRFPSQHQLIGIKISPIGDRQVAVKDKGVGARVGDSNGTTPHVGWFRWNPQL